VKQSKAGPPPAAFIPWQPGAVPREGPLTTVYDRVPPTSSRRTKPLNRPGSRTRKPDAAEVPPPAHADTFDVEAFLELHHADLLDVWQGLGAGVDDPAVRRDVAHAYAAQLRGDLAGFTAMIALRRNQAPPAAQATARQAGAVPLEPEW
jgi:hypothetical protein